MSESIWNDSKKTMVFLDQGMFSVKETKADGSTNSKRTNRARFTLAPFNLVNLSTGGCALVPRDNPYSANKGDAFAFSYDTSLQEPFKLSAGEFFFDGSTLIIGSHEMGDHDGQPDNWKGVHKFTEIF